MTKRWGVLGGALAVGLLLTAGAFPAQAAQPAITITSPGEGESVKAGPVIQGSATMPNGGAIETIRVSVTSPVEGRPMPPPGVYPGPGFTYEPVLPFNGVYTAHVLATGRDPFPDVNGPEQRTAERSFKLEVPPVAPSGLATKVDEEKRTVTITWNANPEPDIVGYCVGFVYNGEPAGLPPCQTETERVHKLGSNQPAGEYEYVVVAVRKDAGDGGIAGPGATKKATVTSSPTVALSGGAPPAGGSAGAAHNRPSPSRTQTTTPRAGSRVNLNQFGSLLGDRSELPLASGERSREELDSGFDNELPFGSPRTSIVTGEEAAQELNADPASSGDGRPQELLFLAAGLLATVILMHVLWLKSEVDRVPLEAVPPDDGVDPLGFDRARRTAA